MSVGKTSQFTRYTTTIEVNPSHEPNPVGNWKNGKLEANVDVLHSKKDILDEMQHHLTQMEQELAIVGEESKDLQQRLISRQEELKKKVLIFFLNIYKINFNWVFNIGRTLLFQIIIYASIDYSV